MGGGVGREPMDVRGRVRQKILQNLPYAKSPLKRVKRSDEPRHYPSMMQVADNSTGSCSSFGAAAQVADGTERAGERRLSQRYEVGLPIRVRVLSASTASEWRVGTVLDLSSTGVSFQCGQPLPVNTRIEMVIGWPSQQSTLHPIYLGASGNVVRSHDEEVAARITSSQMAIENSIFAAVNAASSSGI